MWIYKDDTDFDLSEVYGIRSKTNICSSTGFKSYYLILFFKGPGNHKIEFDFHTEEERDNYLQGLRAYLKTQEWESIEDILKI